jgi:excisionase family DNA binding protein
MTVLNLATPLRQTFRGPLAQQIERNLQQRQALFADPLLDLATCRVALGGISESTLNKLIKAGELPVVRIGKNGHRKVRTSALRTFLDKGVKP